MNVSLILRFNNHLVCCIHSRISFCVHFRSLSRYARSCFARQLLRSLHSHSPAILWQMLRYVRQVFVGSSQIIKPFPCHLPHSLSNCQFPMPLNKKCATPAGAVSVRRPHASGSLLPPPSLHSLRLAPCHSARKNTSLCSAVFPLLRSRSRLHNLFTAFQPPFSNDVMKYYKHSHLIQNRQENTRRFAPCPVFLFRSSRILFDNVLLNLTYTI